MPRDLADVLHYFLPEVDSEVDDGPENSSATTRRDRHDGGAKSASPLPILGLPIGERDVVRSALAWNLAIETARLGASTVVVTPSSDQGSPLWPEPGPGPMGTELVRCPATDLESLYKVAGELAHSRADRTRRGGIVFVRIPPAWLTPEAPLNPPVRWMLLLTSANRRDLKKAKRLVNFEVILLGVLQVIGRIDCTVAVQVGAAVGLPLVQVGLVLLGKLAADGDIG